MQKLIIDNVSKKFKQTTVLDHVSYEITSGVVLGIVGQNGAGKSTLLKIMSGLLIPTSGDVTLNGISIPKEANKAMHKIGFLIEEPSLYPFMTGSQILEYCMETRNFTDKNHVEEIVIFLGLEEFLSKEIKKYSSGMKQRMAIACAVIHNPSVIILDEPTNSLDITGIKEVREYIKYLKQQGKTVILSSHLLAEVEDVCDEIIMMDKGKIIETLELKQINTITYEIKLNNADNIIEFLNRHYKNNLRQIFSEYLLLDTNGEELSQMLKHILDNGFSVIGVQRTGMHLEEYYMKKVGKD